MMTILLIISVVAFTFLLYRYLFLLKGIKQIRKQIVAIHEFGETNQLVTNPHNFSELVKLVHEINGIIVSKKKHIADFQATEQVLKEQITHISHDLRTPLASILGYFDLMKGDITTDEKKQYLNIIEKRAKLLRNLLDNYYDLVRVELAEQALQMNAVNVEKLINDVLATFYYDFSDRSIAVEIVGVSNKLTVLADERVLQRVFINLLQNVLKHGCERCEIRHESKARTVIKNKVSSVNQIEIEKVFNRLYSADKTRNTGNSGIGLTIAKLLLEKMGHQIKAELTEDGWFLIEIAWQM